MRLFHAMIVVISAMAVASCDTAAEDEKVTYQMRGLDGHLYRVKGPPGKTREEVRAALLALEPQSGIPASNSDSTALATMPDTFETEQRGPYEGDVKLNYGSSRYGDPIYGYRGEVDESGYVRLKNLNGDTLRGHVDSDGSVRLRDFDGDAYRGRIDGDGSIRLNDYDGSTLSGQLDSDF